MGIERFEAVPCDIAQLGAHTAAVGETNAWARNTGPGSETQVVEAFTAWLTNHGWTCTELVGYGDLPDIIARHPDGRQLIVEAKGVTRSAGTNLDIGYGQLLRRISRYLGFRRFRRGDVVRSATSSPAWAQAC